MLRTRFGRSLTTAVCIGSLAAVTGCSNLPGEPKTQGAVIGGLGGAAAGAAIGGDDNRALGALLGGLLGAGGGYVVGANADKITGKDRESAEEAAEAAQNRPATAQDVATSTTADLNSDSFVTLDEVVAMKLAGLSDQQMIERLEATGQVFELTDEQQNYLRNQGISENVVAQMDQLNRETRERLLDGQQVISQPR